MGDCRANAGHLIRADRHTDASTADEESTAGLPPGYRLRDIDPDMRIGPIIGRIGDAQVDDVDARVGFELCLESVLHIGAGIVGADRYHVSLVGHGSFSCSCRYAEPDTLKVVDARMSSVDVQIRSH